MTTRRSEDLDAPAPPAGAPLLASVLEFSAPPRLPFTISPIAVLLMALRQRERTTEKAVARHGAATGSFVPPPPRFPPSLQRLSALQNRLLGHVPDTSTRGTPPRTWVSSRTRCGSGSENWG